MLHVTANDMPLSLRLEPSCQHDRNSNIDSPHRVGYHTLTLVHLAIESRHDRIIRSSSRQVADRRDVLTHQSLCTRIPRIMPNNRLAAAFSIRPMLLVCLLAILSASSQRIAAQNSSDKRPANPGPQRSFRWVNPLPDGNLPKGLKHDTFASASMGNEVGYCIYLPPSYESSAADGRRYPVVYYLHGGRPGNEIKSARLTRHIDKAMIDEDVPEMIYVFVNGGKVSHYNTPQFDSMGEDVFVKELIPHIDETYRTLANRENRGIEGFSQGGRGTTRIMFRHPNLFSSCAPGGAGYATEKSISENNGRETNNLVFAEGDNTWDLARAYADDPQPSLRILIHVGTKGFNYENNLEYMQYLESLDIPFERLIVDDVPHSAWQIYEQRGVDLMKFHATNFGLLEQP